MKTTAVVIALLSMIALSGQTPASRSVWDGVYTAEQAARGASLYSQHCSPCHGASLEGEDEAPPLSGGEFLSNWSGLTAGDLFERIRTTMPRSKPQSLNRDVNASILSYILSVNKFPAGEKELPGQTEVLKQIRIDATKPDPK